MKILVLPGDGIGPEITDATLAVLDRANARYKLGLEWQIEEIGLGPLKKHGSTLPDNVMEAARKAPGIILGPVDHLQYPAREQGGINPSGELRVKLDLREHPPRQIAHGCRTHRQARRPRDFSRVHRRFLRRPQHVHGPRRVHADRGRRDRGTQSDRAPVRPHLARRVRLGAQAAQESDRRAQGERAAHLRRALSCAKCAKSRRTIRTSSSTRKSSMRWRRCSCAIRSKFDCIVTGNMFGDILSDEASEISRQPRSCRFGDGRRRRVLRAGAARLGAGHRGPGQSQPDFADPVGGDAARLAGGPAQAFRVRPGRESDRSRDRRRAQVGGHAHSATSAASSARKTSPSFAERS